VVEDVDTAVPAVEPAETPAETTAALEPAGFAALGLGEALVAAVTALGYEEPTAIQREAIPPLLEGRDVLGQAATGTGKTAAFALPLLARLTRAGRDRSQIHGLVLVPTRELAMQVAEAVHKFGRGSDVRVLPVFGGQPMGQQLRALSRGVDVVVATPGRALDHLRRGSLDLSGVESVVLDEADEMLDMGFAEDLEAILKEVPAQRQTALFSATMAPRILSIAKQHLRHPARITIDRERMAPGERPRVREVAYLAQRQHKVATLARVLDMEDPSSALVFCRTRMDVDELTGTLGGRGYRAEAIHGGLTQEQRDRVMKRFREGAAEILVATDVAARGLDIVGLSHVFNYDVPSSPDAYVHRVGRTGRAGKEGVAITLLDARERRLLQNIEFATKRKIAIEAVPTVTDLRARRIELTRAALEESLASDGLEPYRVVIESLARTHDPLDLAAAAMKLADEGRDGATSDEAEIPAVALPAASRDVPEHRPARGTLVRERRPGGDLPRDGLARLFIGAGRSAGVRPADLVGAIANEAKLSSSEIGAIEIADRFSLVEVPESAIDNIVRILRKATIRGKKPLVRRDRDA